ncbi:hypothetical protein ABID22_001120 [Pontibacter aydingkolensis]
MINNSVLAVAAALNGPASNMATPVQHTAKPNAPPGYNLKVDCTNRDLKAGETHKRLALSKTYAAQHCCIS